MREKLCMTWDLSDGQNIGKEFFKRESSSKISAKVFEKVINQTECVVTLLLLLWKSTRVSKGALNSNVILWSLTFSLMRQTILHSFFYICSYRIYIYFDLIFIYSVSFLYIFWLNVHIFWFDFYLFSLDFCLFLR